MRTPVRLLAYAAALVVVFAVAFIGGRTLLPGDLAQAGQGRTGDTAGHGEEATQAGHGSAGGGHGEEPAGGQDSAPAADPVRGLSVAQDGYQLEALSAPRRVGQDGTLRFRVIGPDGRPVTDYTTAHDKDLHLIVVRTDGTQFHHVHPTLDGEGTWSLPWRWGVAGSYRVFADFVPAATGETLTLTSTVEVAGTVQPAPPGPDRTRTTVDGFTVILDGAPVAGEGAELLFTVTRGGTPVTLQPYLGAAGHLVALRVGDLAYLHVHPMDDPAGTGRSPSDPQVAFMAEAPTPGRYLLYLDFRVDGQVRTATFTATR